MPIDDEIDDGVISGDDPVDDDIDDDFPSDPSGGGDPVIDDDDDNDDDEEEPEKLFARGELVKIKDSCKKSLGGKTLPEYLHDNKYNVARVYSDRYMVTTRSGLCYGISESDLVSANA